MKQLASQFILWYLRTAAHLQLKKIQPKIIGVAGSSGKSSLTKLLGEVLSSQYTVLNSDGKNSETSIPLNLLGVHMDDYRPIDWIKALIMVKWQLLTNWKKYDIYIAEMGIDSPVEPKNMSYLLKIVQPEIAMVTNVSLEHSVYFDEFIKSDTDRKEKIFKMTADQELLLLKNLNADQTAIVNLDDKAIRDFQRHIQAKQATISLENEKADLFAKKITVSVKEFVIQLVWHEKEYTVTIPQPLPAFYGYEFLFALVTALSLEINLSEAIKSLENHFSLPPGRLSIFKGIKNTTIIDSTYNNGTLEPIMGILDMMRQIAGRQRKVAIIGDMRELGSQSKHYHEIVAEKLAAIADEIILIGPLMKNYAVPVLKRQKASFQSFNTFTNAKETILTTIKENDLILVKGSQNTLFLERVVEMLLADKSDVKKLCRRGVFWDEKRKETL